MHHIARLIEGECHVVHLQFWQSFRVRLQLQLQDIHAGARCRVGIRAGRRDHAFRADHEQKDRSDCDEMM